MSDKKPTIVAIEGGKKKPKMDMNDETAKLFVDSEIIELDSFVLSGVNTDGKRCVLTWNCSLDELASYSMVLETVVRDKIRETLNE